MPFWASRVCSSMGAPFPSARIRLSAAATCEPTGLVAVVDGSPIAGRVIPVRHAGSVDVFLEALERLGPDAAGGILVADNDGRLDEAASAT